jgi:hypothetical protein
MLGPFPLDPRLATHSLSPDMSVCAPAVPVLLLPRLCCVMLLQHGFGMIDRLGGITAIQRHVASMTEYLYNRMSDLRHSNGKPMLQIFGKHHFPNSREVRIAACSAPHRPAFLRACEVVETPPCLYR